MISHKGTAISCPEVVEARVEDTSSHIEDKIVRMEVANPHTTPATSHMVPTTIHTEVATN